MSRFFLTILVAAAAFSRVYGAETAEEFQKLDETHFKQELDAQKHEETIIKLWDAYRPAKDKVAVLKTAPLQKIQIATDGEAKSLPWGIQFMKCTAAEKELTHAQWCAWLDELVAKGVQIEDCEFHQSAFDAAKDGQPAKSTFNVLFHAFHPASKTRVQIKGPTTIVWSGEKDKDGLYKIQSIDARGLTAQWRSGAPAFDQSAHILAFQMQKHSLQLKRASHPEPLLVYDLDGNGLPEIISAGWNLVFMNKGDGEFSPKPLVEDAGAPIYGAVIADVNGDGRGDLIQSAKDKKLTLHLGQADATFTAKGVVIEATETLSECLAITAGDIDKDGDIDLWVTQYKGIYGNGEMPHPSYFDANDSRPSYLLINDGKGNFADKTQGSGLESKRNRRTYSAVFVDIDSDGDLDLINCADYCGVDLFINDGAGKFSDTTAQAFKETKSFGMSLALGDFNADGKQDFFMTGMGSTTARRLSYMKLGRPGFPEHDAMRLRMGYGNRMYLAQGNNVFDEASFKDNVARTGWSWGCSAMDFDNDSFPDLFVCNGLQSGESARDFCTEFWRRDVYLSSPKPNAKLDQFYSTALQDLHKGRISWNGFEHKNLLLNLGGKDFVNVAYVMGCAYEYDSRSMAGADFDLDGRVDLIFTQAGGITNEGIHLVKNSFDAKNNWIGVHLREEGGGSSPLGATVTVSAGGKKQTAHVVAGDSYMTQHPFTKHFGLGKEAAVDSIEVRWISGKTKKIEKPEIGKYHIVRP